MRLVYHVILLGLFTQFQSTSEQDIDYVLSELSFQTSPWDSFKSYLPNVFRFKRNKIPKADYDVFVNDLSAVGRILNGLDLDRKLQKGSLDMVKVVAEMAGIGLDRSLLDELERMKWEESEKTIGNLTNQMSSFSGPTWDDQKIMDGLAALEGLVEKVKPIAATLDFGKIEKILDAVGGIESLDYTLIGESHMKNLSTLLTELTNQKDPVPSAEISTVVVNIQSAKQTALKVEETMKMIGVANEKLGPLNTVLNGDTSMKELFGILNVFKQSASDSQKFKDLAAQLNSFSGTSDKVVPLRNSLKSLNPSLALLEKFVNAFVSGYQMKMNLTLGLPHGPADLDAISSDLKLTRNQKLMSGGGNMTVLEDDLKLIMAKKEEIRKTVTDWKTYHLEKNLQLNYLQDLKSLSATTTVSSSQPSIKSLVSFCNNIGKLFTITAGNTFNPAKNFNDLTESVHDSAVNVGFLGTKSKEINHLSDLSALKSALKHDLSAQDGLTAFKSFSGVPDIKTSLNVLTTVSGKLQLFSNLKTRSEALSKDVPNVVTLRDWSVDVKNFQKPKDLDKSLSATQDILTSIQKVEPNSLNSIGTVITEVKAMTKSAAALKTITPAVKPKADDSKVSIDTWQKLGSYANTIGHAVRSAQALSLTDGIGAKLEQLKTAAKELDDAVQKAMDPKAKAELQKVWPGYGKVDLEVNKMNEDAKTVRDSMPEKMESLADMTPVFEKMKLVDLQFTQLQKTVTSFDTFSTTDPDLKQKTSTLQKSLKESMMPVLSFQSSKQELKSAPDVLQSISLFFKDFFGGSNPVVVVGESTTPEAAAETPWWHTVLIVGGSIVGVTAIITGIIWCVYRFFKKPIPQKTRPKPVKPAKREVSIDMDPTNPTGATTTPATNGATTGANSTISGSTEAVTRPSRESSAEPETPKSVEQAADQNQNRPTTQKTRKNRNKSRSKSPAAVADAGEVDAVPPNDDGTTTEDGDTARTAEIPVLSSETRVSLSNIPPTTAPIIHQPPKKKTDPDLALMLAKQEPMPRGLLIDSFPFIKNVNNGGQQPDYNAVWPAKSLSMDKNKFKKVSRIKRIMALFDLHFPKIFSRLFEQAKLGTDDRAPRDSRHQLIVRGLGREPYSFYEYKTAESGAELIAQKPDAAQFAIFLEKAFQWGAVSIAAIVQEHLIGPNGSDRWWPSAISNIVVHGKMTIKLISESINEQRDIYTAKLEMWKTKTPAEVSTVHMNILTSEFTADRLISVEALARFEQRIQHSQFAAGGVLLRYGNSFETQAIMMCIHQCMYNILHVGHDYKNVINDMQDKMQRGIVTKEQYVLICLVIARLNRAILELPPLLEYLEMERQFDVLRGAVLPPAAVAVAPAPVLPVEPTVESEAS